MSSLAQLLVVVNSSLHAGLVGPIFPTFQLCFQLSKFEGEDKALYAQDIGLIRPQCPRLWEYSVSLNAWGEFRTNEFAALGFKYGENRQ